MVAVKKSNHRIMYPQEKEEEKDLFLEQRNLILLICMSLFELISSTVDINRETINLAIITYRECLKLD